MTAREQDYRKAHRERVLWVFGLLGFGAMSLWLLIEGVVWVSHRLGGVQ